MAKCANQAETPFFKHVCEKLTILWNFSKVQHYFGILTLTFLMLFVF